MPYTYLTLAQFRTELANRLGDPNKLFWIDAELIRYTNEALRTWSTLSFYWRGTGTFPSVQNQAFYDITSASVQMTSLLGFTVKDQDLVSDIQYHLMEPATGNSWTGSEQFTLSDLTKAIERRRNQFLVETGMIVSHSTQVIGVNPSGRIIIDESIIDLRRIAYKDVAGNYTLLRRGDEFQFNAFNQGWANNPNTPQAFSIATDPVLNVQLAPVPNNNGTLDILSINTPAALDPTAGVLMNIPDDFCWIIKWGALADLLGKSGIAMDPIRAKYCEMRWKEGLEIAKIAVSAMQARIANVPVQIHALADFDNYNNGWQNGTGSPSAVAMAGFNLLALAPVPDAGPYSITLDVVRSAPLTDPIQIGKEELDAIIDYAQHLAEFKKSGQDFSASSRQMKQLMKLALVYNERLRASALMRDPLTDREIRESKFRPQRYDRYETQPSSASGDDQ